MTTESLTANVEKHKRQNLVQMHVGFMVEMLAGPDQLTADRGRLLGLRADNGIDEAHAIIEFEKNGRWAVPVGELFFPWADAVLGSSTSFIVAGLHASEKKQFEICFVVVPGSGTAARA